MILLGVWMIGRAFYAVELSPETFSIRFLTRSEYRCASFVGYRRIMTQGKGGRFYRYLLVGGPGQRDVPLRLDTTLFTDEDRRRLEDWISRFPDLESADLEREEVERRERQLHPGPGRAPLSRRRARHIARAFGLAGILAVFLMTLIGHTSTYSLSRLALAVAVCLVVPATVALKVWQPDAFQMGSALGSRLPASLNTAFATGSLAPIFPAVFGYRPMRWDSAVLPALAASALIGVPLFAGGLGRLDRAPRTLASSAALVLLYGYFATLTLNGAFDRARPALLSGVVRDRRETHGRYHSYKLFLEWNDAPGLSDGNNLAVPRPVYDRSPLGSEVRVAVGPGAFGIRWIAGVLPPE
jgi:hypothetical protein